MKHRLALLIRTLLLNAFLPALSLKAQIPGVQIPAEDGEFRIICFGAQPDQDRLRLMFSFFE